MRARWRLGSRFAGLNGNDNAVELRDGEVDLFPLLIAQPPYAGHERQHLISPDEGQRNRALERESGLVAREEVPPDDLGVNPRRWVFSRQEGAGRQLYVACRPLTARLSSPPAVVQALHNGT